MTALHVHDTSVNKYYNELVVEFVTDGGGDAMMFRFDKYQAGSLANKIGWMLRDMEEADAARNNEKEKPIT